MFDLRLVLLIVLIVPLIPAQPIRNAQQMPRHHHPSYRLHNGENSLRNYELRRPLQYFFYLLQMKSQFNPMLGPLHSMNGQCSSKAGPFCRITGHQPFQTHAFKYSSMNDQMKGIYNTMMAQQRQTFQSYENVRKFDNQMFLIRNDLINSLQQTIKTAMGDRLHLNQLLPMQDFQILM